MFWFQFITFLAVVGLTAGFVFARREQLRTFFGEVRFEMTKVVWPPIDDVINSTILIGVVTIAMSILCLMTDTVFSAILKAFYNQ